MMDKLAVDAEILIVDDEPDVRRAVKRFLGRGGFHVRAVGSAEEALDIIRRRPVAVLLADIKLAGVDGLSLLRQAEVICPETVRIVFSAAAAEQELQEWIDTGRIFQYIPKPMDLSEFRQTLRRAVDRYFENRGEVPFCA